MVRRAPLLLVAAVGFWLWNSSGSERTILWQLPAADRAAVERVEIQLRDANGRAVKREQFYYPQGAPPEISQKLRLKDGSYEALVFLTPKDGGVTRTVKQPVEVEGETIIERLP